MIEVIVNTEWQGAVAGRQQFLEQAQAQQEDLLIFHDVGRMRIPWEEVYSQAIRKSEHPVRDRFSEHPPGYLYYYDWRPEVKQIQMELK